MKRYSPQLFLEQFKSGTIDKYVIPKTEYVKKSKFKEWKSMKFFRKYLEQFMYIAYENDIKIKVERKRRLKIYTFDCAPYTFRLSVYFRVDYDAVNNRYGMEKCFVVDIMHLEVFEMASNITVKYGKLYIWNNCEKLFKKFLKKIYIFIRKDDRMNAWLILQGIDAEKIREVFDGI